MKRKYTIKYTNNYTILYVEDEKDHKNLFSSFREAKISHHSYSSRSEKSQAFVLRGIAKCTTIEQIEEDLMLSYDIKVRDFYKMSTKNCPLFLIVTDSGHHSRLLKQEHKSGWKHKNSLKNAKIYEEYNTVPFLPGLRTRHRKLWTPPKCLKCTEDHHTRSCQKTRETPATCINCLSEHRGKLHTMLGLPWGGSQNEGAIDQSKKYVQGPPQRWTSQIRNSLALTGQTKKMDNNVHP